MNGILRYFRSLSLLLRYLITYSAYAKLHLVMREEGK
jgi:hypothetical protein